MERERTDEDQSRETVDGGYLLDITEEDLERLEGKGATAINPSGIERMVGEERASWNVSLEAELNSLIKRDVKEDITTDELYERYWSKGKQVKRMHQRLLRSKSQPLMDMVGGNPKDECVYAEMSRKDAEVL